MSGDSKGTSDLGIKIGVEEIVVRVEKAKRSAQQRLGCRAVGRIAVKLRQSCSSVA